MTKDLVIIVLGIWTALLSFLGLPAVWDRALLLVTGFTISILMFILRRDFFNYVRRLRKSRDGKRQTDTYAESEIHSEIEPVAVKGRLLKSEAIVTESNVHAEASSTQS